MSLALSTAWNGFRYEDGKGIIREIRELGFKEVELSFNLTPRIVDDIAGLVKKGEIKVVSLHNFCPIPEGLKREVALPDCYSVASLDEENRRQAVKFTKISIDTALRLNARAVVMHCGRVEMKDRTRDLLFLYNLKGRCDAPECLDLKETMKRERRERAEGHFQAALKSLEELSTYATKQNISLGVENRYYFREIPSFEETGEILRRFKGSSLFYWHDTGHAQLWENLRFLKHKDYLDNYGARLLGMHLHDIIGGDDHLAPLKGNLDFKAFKPYLKEDTIKTLEAHHPALPEDMRKAKEYLEKTLEDKK